MPLTCDPERIWLLFVLLKKKKKKFLKLWRSGEEKVWKRLICSSYLSSLCSVWQNQPLIDWLSLPGLQVNHTYPPHLLPPIPHPFPYCQVSLLFLLRKRKEKTRISSLWLPKRGLWGPGLILIFLQANNAVHSHLLGSTSYWEPFEHSVIKLPWMNFLLEWARTPRWKGLTEQNVGNEQAYEVLLRP